MATFSDCIINYVFYTNWALLKFFLLYEHFRINNSFPNFARIVLLGSTWWLLSRVSIPMTTSNCLFTPWRNLLRFRLLLILGWNCHSISMTTSLRSFTSRLLNLFRIVYLSISILIFFRLLALVVLRLVVWIPKIFYGFFLKFLYFILGIRFLFSAVFLVWAISRHVPFLLAFEANDGSSFLINLRKWVNVIILASLVLLCLVLIPILIAFPVATSHHSFWLSLIHLVKVD